MPYHDEEYPGQPLWQSVLLFCCKGVIEGIMVVLFFWLLVQVLFTKQLEVHLQVLLLVGLIVFCLCLLLGCVLCWRKSDICPLVKEHVASSPGPSEPAIHTQDLSPGAGATDCSGQQYEELDGDILDYPSSLTSVDALENEQTSSPFSSQACFTPLHTESTKPYFSLRRLSTPQLTTPLYRPIDHCHDSSPLLPKIGLFSKTCKSVQRLCTLSVSSSEHSRLTSPSAFSPADDPIPLTPLSYGSSSSCKQAASAKISLHFSSAFSPEQQRLTVCVLSLTGTPHRLEEVSVLGSLPPLYPCPIQATVQSKCSSNTPNVVMALRVNSVKELQRCVLRIVVHTRGHPSMGGTTLGQLEVLCEGKHWAADHQFYFTKELLPNNKKPIKSLNSQDAIAGAELSCPPPQVFIVLQYNTLTHCIKAMVLKADNLRSLSHTAATPDYSLVVNLYHNDVLLCSRESDGGSPTVRNAPILFDLPPGDISHMSLTLEFLIVQSHALSKSRVLGKVVVGSEAPDAGRAHWRDMCSLGQVEQARWHTVRPVAQ